MAVAEAQAQRPDAAEVPIKLPIKVYSKEFRENKWAYYSWLRDNAPVCPARIALLNGFLVSRYEDCASLLKDPRFVRNRSTATGGGRRTLFPVPKSVALMAQSMITTDNPDHRRLRTLVQKAFTPGALKKLEQRVEHLTHSLLDEMETRLGSKGSIDLMERFALPIPVTVISEMVGVSAHDMPRFRSGIQTMTKGVSGWRIFKTLFWDLRRSSSFVRDLIRRKREEPADDILTGLIQAEEDGDSLTEDELVSLVFLLVVAGFETTVHLISNSVLSLVTHPDQLDRFKADAELGGTMVEEVLRFNGPIHGTKPNYAAEDVTWHGVDIPRGSIVIPLLASANHDPRAFDDPEVFDIARSPNRHLGFGWGPHICLGAALARMETRIAVTNLFDRFPDLDLAVDESALELRKLPMWHSLEALPVKLR